MLPALPEFNNPYCSERKSPGTWGKTPLSHTGNTCKNLWSQSNPYCNVCANTMDMSEQQKAGRISSVFFILLVSVLFITACMSVPAFSAATTASPPVPATGTPATPGTVTTHGTVSSLNRMNCPCFTLVTAIADITVWYDLMAGPDGTRKPAVPIDNLADGMEIWVTGMPQDSGKFWAESIRTARP
jgi:hypothetical protein